jgi:hypothetical protein
MIPGFFGEGVLITMSQVQQHWLVRMAVQAGLDVSTASALSPKAAAEEAWDAIVHACRIDAGTLASHISKQSRPRLADTASVEESALKLVPERIARQFRVLPLRVRNNQFIVATWTRQT